MKLLKAGCCYLTTINLCDICRQILQQHAGQGADIFVSSIEDFIVGNFPCNKLLKTAFLFCYTVGSLVFIGVLFLTLAI
jgi:hypothetical protein